MPTPWVAVRAEANPLTRARELQRSWEHLVAGGGLEPELAPEATQGLRPTILESWRRSFATGLKPTDLLAPIEVEQSTVRERWLEHPLGSLVHVLAEQLEVLAEDSKSLVVVTDASGLVLHRVGADWLKERAAEMHLVEGAQYSEAVDGTNGIGTALAANHAFQVFAFEHFNARHHEWMCTGAPVHDPISGRVIGLIDLSSLWKIAHPRSLELVTTAARTMEQRLLDARRDRDARLLRRYSDLASRSTDLLVNGDGYVLTGDESTHATPLDIPAGGGEIVLDAGSVAVAEPLGQGEAYLVRRLRPCGARTAPVRVLERAEEHARELASEQAALRQAATLVARESPPGRLFAVVTEQIAQVFDVPLVRLVRYEPDGLTVVGAFSEGDDEPFPIGSRWPLDTPGVAAIVRETGRPARVEDYAQMPGQIAAVVRGTGMRSAVGSPIVVEGRLWGAMLVLSPRREPLPEDTETRLTDFTELVATAIANAESRVAVARLADEQAALRRVATLVAEDVPASELFDAVTREVGTLLGGDFAGMARFEDDAVVTVGIWAAEGEHPAVPHRWQMQPGDPATTVAEAGGAARWDEWTDVPGPIAEFIRELGIRSTVGTPIMVGGRLWGALALHSKQSVPLPPDTESRMGQFTDLVATAIANGEARAEVDRLAEEQAALRRVATLVAQGASPRGLFDAVAEELGRLLSVESATIGRFEPDDSVIAVASWSTTEALAFPTGMRWATEGTNIAWRVRQTGRTARIDDFSGATDPIGVTVRETGIKSAVGSPIVVNGHPWGLITAATTEGPMAPDTEARLASFTELVATAIANAESHAEVERLAEEQAALRRVATLVAREASQPEVFSAIVEEIGRLIGADEVRMLRYESGDEAVIVAAWGEAKEASPVGARLSLEGDNASARVLRTARPARLDAYQLAKPARSIGIRSVIATPILVDGRLWGVIPAGTTRNESFPPEIEGRLGQFTELVATAIANAESHAEVERLAEEQAALRRVATLVAQGASPSAVLDAVAAEMERVLGADGVTLSRYEPDEKVVFLAHSGVNRRSLPPGSRVSHQGENVTSLVRHSRRSARIDHHQGTPGPIAELARSVGARWSVGAPVVVEGRLWGVAIANWSDEHSPPSDTEERMAQFAELLDTAIANADSRDQLTASRARLVTEGDEARRRVVRDLHDGAQQRLVHTIMTLKLAQRALRKDDEKAEALIGEALERAQQGNAELRELAHGILPAVLTNGGLQAGVDTFVARLDLPVEVDIPADRFPTEIEASAYFIVAEALTNVVKHSHARHAEVRASVEDRVLQVEVRDDGIGGVDPGGHGLVGIGDRVTALGGQLKLESPADGGTLVSATLPLSAG